MDYCVEPNEITDFVNFAYVAPFDPRRADVRHARPDRIGTVVAGLVDFFEDSSGPSAPTYLPSSSPKSDTVSYETVREVQLEARPEPQSEAYFKSQEIAAQRVKLMAYRYATGTESSEVLARLEILGTRLLQSAPRISPEQIEALELATVQIEKARTRRQEIADRLNRKG